MAKAPLVEWIEYGTARVLAAVVGRLPWRCATGAGKLCGAFLYYVLPGTARGMRGRIRSALQCSPRRAARIARASCAHTVAVLFELMRMRRMPPEKVRQLVEFENLEVMDRALQTGRGVIAVTGHIGNWELLAAGFALTGRPLSVVVRPLDNRRLDRLVEDLRRSWGAAVVPRDSLPLGIRQMLKGGVLAFLMDQNAARHGVFVPFFGREAATAAGPASLALRRGVPAVLCWARRLPGGRHRLTFAGPLEPVYNEDAAEAVRLTTARYTAALEQVIRQAPEQWLWAHPRWRTRPDGAAAHCS